MEKEEKAVLKGFITDEHLTEAEVSFPGIGELLTELRGKGMGPATFLDLVMKYMAKGENR